MNKQQCPKCKNKDKHKLLEFTDALNPVFKCECKICGYKDNVEKFRVEVKDEP